MVFTNEQMGRMIETLKTLLPQRNKAGYVAARNTRLLMTELTEFNNIRNELIRKYGKPDVDEDGRELGTVSIDIGSEEFRKFTEEIGEYINIEHDVQIMKMKYDEVVGILSGEEILALDWMLEEE